LTGLELILDRIISDANKVAEEKISVAKEQIKAIDAEYEQEIKDVTENGKKTRAEQIESLKERTKTEKNAYLREMLLKEERNTAKELIEAAKNKILDMPKDEYFAFLAEIYKNHNDMQGGEILLCKEDKENLPADFVEKLNKSLTLSKDEIKGKGFIIRDGKVELNCTIDALFYEKESELFDVACKKE